MSAICSFEGARARAGSSGPIWSIGYRHRAPFGGVTVHGAPLAAIQAIRRCLKGATSEVLIDEMTVEFSGGASGSLYNASVWMAELSKGLYLEGAVCVGESAPSSASANQLHFSQIAPAHVDRDAVFFTLAARFDSLQMNHAPQDAVSALRGALSASGISIKKEKFKPEDHTNSFIYSTLTNMTGMNGKLVKNMGRLAAALQSVGYYVYASTGAPGYLDLLTFSSLVPAIQSRPCACLDPPLPLSGTGPLRDVPLGSKPFWAAEHSGKFVLQGAFPLASQHFEAAVKRAGGTISSTSADPGEGDYSHSYSGSKKTILLHWIDLLAGEGICQLGAPRLEVSEDGTGGTGMLFGGGFSILPGTVITVQCSFDTVELTTCGLEAHGTLIADLNMAMGEAIKKSWKPERGLQRTSVGSWKMHGMPFTPGGPPNEWGGKTWFALANSLQSLGFHQIGKYGGRSWEDGMNYFFFARPLQ